MIAKAQKRQPVIQFLLLFETYVAADYLILQESITGMTMAKRKLFYGAFRE